MVFINAQTPKISKGIYEKILKGIYDKFQKQSFSKIKYYDKLKRSHNRKIVKGAIKRIIIKFLKFKPSYSKKK